MQNPNFKSLQQTIANHYSHPRKPLSGFYVETTTAGSSAASTVVVRPERKTA